MKEKIDTVLIFAVFIWIVVGAMGLGHVLENMLDIEGSTSSKVAFVITFYFLIWLLLAAVYILFG